MLSKKSSSDAKKPKDIIQNDLADTDEDESQYKKTPKLNRKQVSIRTSRNTSSAQSNRNTSSAQSNRGTSSAQSNHNTSSAQSNRDTSSTQPSQSSSDQNIFSQNISDDDDIDEEDEIALKQQKQINTLKKKLLTP
jgi:hypothetical protein